MDNTIPSGEAGRKGGLKVLAKYGPKHFSEIGKKGGNTPKKKRNKKEANGTNDTRPSE